MSERIQRRARDDRDAARAREQLARARAERNHDRGDEAMERAHRFSADRQHESAERAEQRRVDDVHVEGDQLGEER